MKTPHYYHQLEHAVVTGCYPHGFTFKDLLKAKHPTFHGKPIDYAVGFKNYPVGTTKHDLEGVKNTWRKTPVAAWDDLVEFVSRKEKTSPSCAERRASAVIATPDVAFVLRPLENTFHAEILDCMNSRLHLCGGVYNPHLLTRRTKIHLARNEQIFLYVLQNYPHLANSLLPFRKPRFAALALVRQRLVGPVLDAKYVQSNSQDSCPSAFAEMMMAFPRLFKTLETKESKFHRKIVDAAISSGKLTPKTRSALAATGPYAMSKLL